MQCLVPPTCAHPLRSLARFTTTDAAIEFFEHAYHDSHHVSLAPQYAVVFGTVSQVFYGGDFLNVLVRLFSTMASMFFFLLRLRAVHNVRVRRVMLRATSEDVRPKMRLARNLSWKMAAPLIVASFALFSIEMEGLISAPCSVDHPTWRYCKQPAFPLFHRIRPLWAPNIDPNACPCKMFELKSTGLPRDELERVVEDALNNSVYLSGFAMRNNTAITPKMYPSVMRRHIDLYVLYAVSAVSCIVVCGCTG